MFMSPHPAFKPVLVVLLLFWGCSLAAFVAQDIISAIAIVKWGAIIFGGAWVLNKAFPFYEGLEGFSSTDQPLYQPNPWEELDPYETTTTPIKGGKVLIQSKGKSFVVSTDRSGHNASAQEVEIAKSDVRGAVLRPKGSPTYGSPKRIADHIKYKVNTEGDR
jgi:hypothetical protein